MLKKVNERLKLFLCDLKKVKFNTGLFCFVVTICAY